MRTITRNRCFLLFASLAVFGLSASAQAGAITPWSGASASVHSQDQTKTDAGASASVDTSGYGTIPFQNGTYPGQVYALWVRESASAQATGQANGLLQLNASSDTGNPGSNPSLYQYPHVTASASWAGDSVHLEALDGTALPDHIQLDFRITYRPLNYALQTWHDRPELTFVANGTTATMYGDVGADLSNPHAGLSLDSFTHVHIGNSYGQGVEAAFHLDLPINANGVSSPFSVSLLADVANRLVPNEGVASYLKDVNLSLSDITLPDGTPLTDAGYGVTFASGMAWPQPNAVPEPASIAVWAGLAMAAGWWRFGKKRRLGK